MVNLNEQIANMNFWLEQLPAQRRQFFFHWLEDHTRNLGAALTLDTRLDGQFHLWIESLPEEVQDREICIVLSEIAWAGIFHNQIHPYIQMSARLSS